MIFTSPVEVDGALIEAPKVVVDTVDAVDASLVVDAITIRGGLLN